MCLSESVGEGCANAGGDVRVVQALINCHLDRLPGIGPLVVDGKVGARTVAAIRAFQARVMGSPEPDGRIDCGGSTISRLLEGIAPTFGEQVLGLVMINAPAERIARFCGPLGECMLARRIDTPLRQSHFLAQIGHESGELRHTRELADGTAYENREDLGNIEDGDGPRFKGRGLIQLTGRANYAEYGRDIGENLLSGENAERVAEEDRLAVDVACWFWAKRDLNKLADADNLEAVTRRINGGLNGLEHRRELLIRAKGLLIRQNWRARLAAESG